MKEPKEAKKRGGTTNMNQMYSSKSSEYVVAPIPA